MLAPIREFFTVFRAFAELDVPEMESDSFAYPGKSFEHLLAISQGMTQHTDSDQVLGYLLSTIRETFEIDCGVLALVDEKIYRVRIHRGFSASLVSDLSIPLGEGVLGRAAAAGQGIALPKEQFDQILGAGELFKSMGWGSILIVPIMLQSQNMGILIAGSADRSFFTPSRITSLKPYIQILSVGMRNAEIISMMEKFNRRLTAEVTSTTQELTQTNERLIHRVRELKALYEITLAASMQANLDDIFEAISEKIADFFRVEYVAFFVNSSPRGRKPELVLRRPSFGISGESQPDIRISAQDQGYGEFLSAIVKTFSKGEPQYFNGGHLSLIKEMGSHVPEGPLRQHIGRIILRSFTAMPLKTAQGVCGVLVLANPVREVKTTGEESSEAMNDEDLRTLTLLAIRIATSIENAELEDQNRRRMGDLSALRDIDDTFYATPVLEFILAKMVRVITKTFKCKLCDFLLLEPAAAALVAHPASTSAQTSSSSTDSIPVRDSKNTSSQVFAERQSRIVENIQDDLSLSRLGLEHKISSIMLVPLRVEQEVIGVLRLGSVEEGFFDNSQLRLAELIADRSAVIVQNARLYERIMAANRELERLNKVKTEFVSMVSHELRTPVTAIKGFVDVVLAEDAGPINDQQRRFLNIAHNSIDRLSLLISDLLDISRIEAGQLKIVLQPASIKKIMQDSYETYRNSIESKKLKFEVHVDKKIPMVIADESRVKQVIDNLIANSMKFTPENGSIRISVDDLGDFVLVSVADNGVGIKKEDQDRIFNMFFQVDSSLTRKVGGTGLGLAISKAIVEMHGGRIWVESEVGRGSTFRFLLPRYREGLSKSQENSDS